jgi:hypothetical protein
MEDFVSEHRLVDDRPHLRQDTRRRTTMSDQERDRFAKSGEEAEAEVEAHVKSKGYRGEEAADDDEGGDDVEAHVKTK